MFLFGESNKFSAAGKLILRFFIVGSGKKRCKDFISYYFF
jgi:hypothetical protein